LLYYILWQLDYENVTNFNIFLALFAGNIFKIITLTPMSKGNRNTGPQERKRPFKHSKRSLPCFSGLHPQRASPALVDGHLHAAVEVPGTDLMKLDFGRKVFGQIFILE
jgi:hypothetical protein